MSERADRHPMITAHMATYISVRRHELGLSLEQVAERCGSSKAHIWALERRKSKNPTLWLILALCDALNCSLNSLIGADVSQPMFSEQEMALIDAHRRIFDRQAKERLPYDLRLQVGKALDRLVCDDSTPEQVDKFIGVFAEFGLSISPTNPPALSE
ncbi:helix-turn-helix domain-containing protein [Agrobacterium tumefaciens]|uniref:helix-turn-helix domain-containing protein n=1 Tax=Agrobacterium tumefaciens TaxID=358 RepID=UPI001F2200BE|nr:helix-turn-helix transcriptional regulator [Agrobacterium tumefaciens]